MFDLDRWNEIIETLKKNKLRSLLTAFGVFWGIFMLVVMVGAGQGIANGISNDSGANVASNSFIMWTQKTNEPYKGFLRGRYWTFNNSDVDYLRTRVEGVEVVAPMIFNNSNENTTYKDKDGTFSLKGEYPEWIKIDPMDVIAGRWLNAIDIKQKRKVCVVGENVVEEMFLDGEDPIGEYLKIRGIYYQVVGVIRSTTRVNLNGKAKDSIFLPFTTMQQAHNYGDDVYMMGVMTNENVRSVDLEPKVLNLMKERHAVSPTDVKAIGHVNVEKQYTTFKNLIIGIKLLIWIVGIGTLLAGVIGVSNIMLVIIKERTQEIGIMRAIGATPRKIISQIIQESLFLTSVSGYLGLVLGIALLEVVNRLFQSSRGGNDMFFRNPGIDLNIGIICLLVLIISGIIAGFVPAKKAVKIKPIDALRAE